MPHRSMCKSLKFPREPCWTKMRSLGWLSIKMSLIQPWKAVMGFKHWESVKLSGHPVGKREEAEKNIGMFIYFCWGFLMQELGGSLFQVFSFLVLRNLLCHKSFSKKKKKKKITKRGSSHWKYQEYEVFTCVKENQNVGFFPSSLNSTVDSNWHL